MLVVFIYDVSVFVLNVKTEIFIIFHISRIDFLLKTNTMVDRVRMTNARESRKTTEEFIISGQRIVF